MAVLCLNTEAKKDVRFGEFHGRSEGELNDVKAEVLVGKCPALEITLGVVATKRNVFDYN